MTFCLPVLMNTNNNPTINTPVNNPLDSLLTKPLQSMKNLAEIAINTMKPIAIKTQDLRAVVHRAAHVGQEGALISIGFAGMVYPMATVASTQMIQGGSAKSAAQQLSAQGGIGRYYKGIVPSALGMMVARFCDAAGDMAASEFIEQKYPQLKNPVTCAIFGALVAGALYYPLMPLETLAITARSSGAAGVKKLGNIVAQKGIAPLYNGANESVTAAFVDHLVWYGTRHFLDSAIPKAQGARNEFLRNCLIGALSGIASDTFSHPITLVKVQKQVLQSAQSPIEIAKEIVKENGASELWRRGFLMAAAAHCFSDAGFQATMAARGNTSTTPNPY